MLHLDSAQHQPKQADGPQCLNSSASIPYIVLKPRLQHIAYFRYSLNEGVTWGFRRCTPAISRALDRLPVTFVVSPAVGFGEFLERLTKP